jgi:rhodanese-related sulfurtransferase
MTPDCDDELRADSTAPVLSIGRTEPVLGPRIDGSTCVTTTNLLDQFDRQFSIAVVDTDVFAPNPARLRAALHLAVQHLEPGGHLVLTGTARDTSMVDEFELVPADTWELSDLVAVGGAIGSVVLRRTARFTVHDMLFEARRMIERIEPIELARRCAGTTPPIVVDTRTHVDRHRHGVIPGAVHIPRTTVEWHLDPANGYQHPMVTSFTQALVVVCNGGYSSSLAAASLHRLGYRSVADLIGGHLAWCTAGLPVESPDHSHLDL